MLEIVVPAQELYDEATNTFGEVKETKLQLEHSLISLRKWEAIHHIPFLHTENKTLPQLYSYFRCMSLNRDVDPSVFDHIPAEQQRQILEYINDPHTATWFNDRNTPQKAVTEQTTAEIIYWQMIELGIPQEYEKWHLNQLLTLIKVVNVKNQDPKKMSRKDVGSMYSQLNAARKAKYHSRG